MRRRTLLTGEVHAASCSGFKAIAAACTRRCRLMSSTRCVILKCKIVKTLFGSEKTTAWQQRVLELDRKNLRWFATASSTVAQNEFALASISSVAPYASTENPWVPRSRRHLP